MASDDENPPTGGSGSGGGVVELPAPEGWKKKYTPKKSSRRNDIIFISPTGDEIKSKKQLDKYLKSHVGGPTASEFDWSTGETPRRSGRLGDKVKATEAPEIEPLSKRSSVKKGSRTRKEDADIENEDLGNDEDVVRGKGDAESEGVEKTEIGEGLGQCAKNNVQGAIVEEPMMPVLEETVAGDSKKEQADDHLDKQTGEISDCGMERRSLDKEAKAENEGGEVNAGLDVIKEGRGVDTETEESGNPKSESNLEYNPELLGNHTVPKMGLSEDAPN